MLIMKKNILVLLFIGCALLNLSAQETETNISPDFTKLKEMYEKE